MERLPQRLGDYNKREEMGKTKMKKTLSVLLLAALMLVALCGAMAEAADVTGAWYASVFGMTMTLTLNEDGSYLMEMIGEEPETGVWKLDGETLIMDEGTEAETVLAYDGTSMTLDLGEGLEVVFTREPIAAFEPSPARTDATLEEYAGEWTCTMLSTMGAQVSPELMDVEMSMSIDGENVVMTLGMFGESITVELTAAFADGALTLVVPSEYEGGEDNVFTIQLLEDGSMSVDTVMYDEAFTFYLSAV